MQIVWDEPKRLSNLQKHELDFELLTEDWFAGAIVVQARLGRRKAVGWLDDQPISVIFFALGAEAFSVISMRPARQDERRLLG